MGTLTPLPIPLKGISPSLMSSSRSREEPLLSERIGALVDERLLAALSQAFPVRIPVPGTPMDKVWYDAGSARVIEFLRECQKQVTEL